MPTATLDLPTKYHLEAQPDGKVLIRGVPIFAAVTERNGKPLPYDAKWMAAALEKHQAQPGYWAPVHYRHHETDPVTGEKREVTERAGDMRQDEIVRRNLDGKPAWVTLATLRFDSEDDARKALKKFPYRSVEIVPDKPDEINSLALLSSEAPFHRFPNLVAFASSADGAHRFVWRTRLMADDKAPADEADEKKDGDKMEAAPPATPGGDVNARLAALEAGMAKCLAALQPAAPAAPAAAPAAKPPVARSPIVAAQTTGSGTRFATDGESAGQVSLETTKAETERDLLAERLERLELERSTEKKLAEFRAELEPYGFTTTREKKLLECLARGEDHARLYVDTVKQNAQKIQRAPRISTSPDAEPGDPPEVAAYAARGPEVLRLARESALTFRAMPANVRATVAGDLKTWLRSDDRGPGPLEA